MHLKELIHRSPLRIFERSVHGGLGRGNLGIVAARPGVGKNAFLTGLALDRLLHGERVLHVTVGESVEHVHERYEEIFAELARESNLEERAIAREQVEQGRIIRSLNGAPFSVEDLARSVSVFEEHADFHPDLIIVAGYDIRRDTAAEELARLKELAGSLGAELWMTARIKRLEPGQDWHEIGPDLSPVVGVASVVVRLQPVQDSVRIRLLKDHDNQAVADLDLDLDPRTLLVRAG